MGLSADFVCGFIGTVVLTVVGFFVSRVFSQTDKNIESLWGEIEKLREYANDCNGRHDLAEERARHALERIASLEARTRQ